MTKTVYLYQEKGPKDKVWFDGAEKDTLKEARHWFNVFSKDYPCNKWRLIKRTITITEEVIE